MELYELLVVLDDRTSHLLGKSLRQRATQIAARFLDAFVAGEFVGHGPILIIAPAPFGYRPVPLVPEGTLGHTHFAAIIVSVTAPPNLLSLARKCRRSPAASLMLIACQYTSCMYRLPLSSSATARSEASEVSAFTSA